MTPTEFAAAVDRLGWSQRGLADLLGCDDRLVRRWANGERSFPPSLVAWLRTLATFHAAHPPPTDWRRRAVAGSSFEDRL
jgi:DNA-binding transcriptional regulator YiaG